MKKLSDILKGVTVKAIFGSTDVPVYALTFDSRRITKGAVFFAIDGEKTNGHKYAKQAADAGASAVVVADGIERPGAVTVCVEDTSEAMGIMTANYYGQPASKLKLVGITGTNGKTTVATLLYQLFNRQGYKSGLISTVANYVGEKKLPADYTTPDVISFNRLLRSMADAGCQYCFAEVSSHALQQKRTAGLNFAGAVFTNITHDHLDYHKTFKNYIYAKKMLFDNLSPEAFALINGDDKNSRIMLQNSKADKYVFSVKRPSDFQVKIIESSFDGSLVELDDREVWILLPGEFNAYNVAAIYGVARLLGLRKNDLLPAVSAFTPVRGRMETFKLSGRTAIIDYAHTPDALENVLKTIKSVKLEAQSLITVVGAGGNRDKEKRPKMARIADMYSDKLILTSDNPRDENPADIIRDMEQGIEDDRRDRILSITNRREAIKAAVMLAKEGDIVLVAGKGHETYQEIKGIRSRFDDKEVITEFLTHKK